MVARLRKKAGTAPQRKKAVLTLDDGDITGFVADLDVKMQERCEFLQLWAMRRSDELKYAFEREILKIPKDIQTMPVKEFYQKYQGDVDLVMKIRRQQVLESTGFSSPGQQPQHASVVFRSAKAISKTMSMRKAARQASGQAASGKSCTKKGGAANELRNRAAAGAYSKNRPTFPNLNTPLRGTKVDPRLPHTPANPAAAATHGSTKAARSLRRGESLMSMNGSPIVGDSVATSIALAIGHDPSQLENDNLTDEDKVRTRERLEELHNKVASLMQHLQQ